MKFLENAIFNPTDTKFLSHVGGLPLGETLEINILMNKSFDFEGLHFSIFPDGGKITNMAMKKIKKEGDFVLYQCHYTPVDRGLYFYNFSFWNGVETSYLTKGQSLTVEINGWCNFQLTVYDKNAKSPDWFKGGVLYQIFPDRFHISGKRYLKKGGVNRDDWNGDPFYHMVNGIMPNNDHFGGNFKGIEEKLSHLKSLGVTALYLNPIYECASNHKYDVGDFKKIDDCFGGEKDFESLTKACEKEGIKVIVDQVYNHCGEDSKYFNKQGTYDTLGAYQSKKSPYFSWFNFTKFPNDYEAWWGIKLLPQIMEDQKSYRDEIYGENSSVDKFLSLGVSGLRLDVIDEIPEDFLLELREKVSKTKKDVLVIGEVWEDASNKIAYRKRRTYFSNNLVDSVMNYPWKDGIIDFIRYGNSKNFYNKLIDLLSNYPKNFLDCLMNILSTHDTMRIVTAIAGEERRGRTREEIDGVRLRTDEIPQSKELLKLATLIQFTLPGVPSIYYGDEFFAEGYQDPFNRRTMKFDKVDEEIFSWFKTLGSLRKDEIFAKGTMKLHNLSENSICFERRDDGKGCLICVNRGNRTKLPFEITDHFTKTKVKTVERNQGVLGFFSY